jgi:hypothetical protein
MCGERMKTILIVIIIICGAFFVCKSVNDIPLKEKLTNEVEFATAQELEGLYDLELCGFGGGTLGGVRTLSLDFTSRGFLERKEARRLVVSCFEVFLRNINNHLELRPLLVEYPFSTSRVEIAIHIPDGRRNPRRQDALAFVYISKGKIRYNQMDSSDKLQTVHEETLEEALKIVREEMQDAKLV